jgi:hypothetical protein
LALFCAAALEGFSPVAIFAIMMARAFTSAGRFSPFGPLGIRVAIMLSGKLRKIGGRVSRKGHYHGGSTSFSRRNSSWFTKDSTDDPPDDGAPERLPTAPMILLAAKDRQSKLLKPFDPRITANWHML